MTHRIMEIRSLCKKPTATLGQFAYSFLIFGKELEQYMSDTATAQQNVSVRFIRNQNGIQTIYSAAVTDCIWMGSLCEDDRLEGACLEVTSDFDPDNTVATGGTDELEVTVPPAPSPTVHQDVYSTYV